jgi:C4-dicarboxylate-specific signal transduction histidine kinase
MMVLMGLVVLAVVLTLGYSYYSLREASFREMERQAVAEAKSVKNHISSFLNENLKSAKVLAGLEEIVQVFSNPNPGALAEADTILDHFHESLGVDVCYLMDRDGKTIASSNRNNTDSFVGKNYGFRPYFQQAIIGKPSVYMALGATSKIPGAYYSHPVYKAGQLNPIGVVVIKSSVESVEEAIRQNPTGILLLTDPNGVIFLSNRKDLLYQVLWEPSAEVTAKIAETKQFGQGPWIWTGFTLKERNKVVDRSEHGYIMYQSGLDSYPGWNLIHLRPSRDF